MWRRYTHPQSIAELQLFQDLQAAGYSCGLTTQIGYQFSEAITEKYGVHGTVVDYLHAEFNLIIFLDGQPHLKDRQIRRDEAITKVLKEHYHYKVLRFPYTAPISKKCRTEIRDKIIEVLDACGYREWKKHIWG